MSTVEQIRSVRPARRRRRPLRRALTVLAVLAALFVVLLAGGGWYYSGQIGDEALTPHPGGPPHRDLVVTSFDGSTVVLHRTATVDHDALRTSDVYGLEWPGGRGVLSGPPRTAGSDVARGLTVVSGTRPAPGTRASLDIYVWTDPTAAYGIPYQQVDYPCAGGTCPAWYLPGTASTWWIGVHGRGATREEPLRAAGPAVTARLPVLDIAYRNDAGAPRDPSGHFGYGATEWHDLDAAVGFATAHGAQHVVLFGSSMGGSIVASFLEHSSRASLVTAVVLDAPALDLRATVEFEAGERTLPVVGAGIPYPLTATAEWLATRRYGLDWNAVDYLPGSWLRVPALVFHGTADATVPIATSDELRRAHPHLVDEVRVPGADHVESWNVDPGAYEAAESAFLGCATGVVSCPAP